MDTENAMARGGLGLWPEAPCCTRLMLFTRSACVSFQRYRCSSPQRRMASGHGHPPLARSARQFLFKFSFAALNLKFISRFAAGQSPVFALYEPVLSEGCVSRAFALEDTLKSIRAVLRVACRYTPRVHTMRTRGLCPWQPHISLHDRALKA